MGHTEEEHKAASVSTEAGKPRSRLESTIAHVWEDMLGVEAVDVDDDFFRLGGESLLAVRMLAAVEELLLVPVDFIDFVEAPTVRTIAAAVERARGRGAGDQPPVERGGASGPAPCTSAQERLWIIEQMDGASGVYNMPIGARIRGSIDPDALERGLQEIVRRHAALRTTFATVDEIPVQIVVPELQVRLERRDLGGFADPEAEAKRIVNDLAGTPFDLERGPLLRAALLRLADDEHVLELVFHHIVCDGWSHVVIFRELGLLYRMYAGGEQAPLPEPDMQYPDYARWQRSRLQGHALDETIGYWRKQLDGIPAALELPTDRARPSRPSYRGRVHRSHLPQETVERVRAFARAEGVTPFITLLSVLNILLFRHTKQETIVIGATTAARDRAELDGVVGLFASTVALRADLTDETSFRALLGQVRETVLEAIAHEDAPFERLVAELRPERDPSRHPIFQVFFAQVPYTPLDLGVASEPFDASPATARFDLTLWVEDEADGLDLVWEYSTDLFDESSVVRMQAHFLRLLEAALVDPDCGIGELPLLSERERRELVEGWSDAGGGFAVGCLHELFEDRVPARPDAVAVSFEGESLSYAELNARANRLARHLRELDVGRGTLVGLCLRRSLDLVVAVVAVLKAGGAYVPLDPDYPAERLAFVLADTAAPVLLTQEELVSGLPMMDASVVVVCVDRDAEDWADRSSEDLPGLAGPEDLAYVIYTSGSTGQPKGVQVEHRNVARLFSATEEWYGFGAQDTWLLFHSYAFDFSVWELWGALLHGGKLVVAPVWTTRSPQALAGLLVDEAVTVLNATPSLFVSAQEALLERSWDLSLRLVVFGGEALQPSSLRPWFKRFPTDGPQLVNMYGITETTVHVTYRPISAEDCERDSSPIGRPIPDLQLYVLDGNLGPVPPGVPGELFVGGAGVARGYLNRPELTAERFLPSPFGQGRLYRSGDSARYRENGEIDFLGRIDDQVKIRGFRIELGEIQSALAEHDSVAECAVVAHQDAGEARLAAYVVPSTHFDSPERLRSELRTHLEQRLPAFMVPASLTLLEQLPLTVNGKLDREALPAPAWEEQSEATFVPPRTPTEIRIADIWRAILGIDRIGTDDNFFHIGGHSLLGARAVTQIREQFAIELSVRALFEHPTLAGLAKHVEAAGGGLDSDVDTDGSEAREAVQMYPPSFPQQQLLFIDKLALDVATYNAAVAVRVVGDLDVDALEGALGDIVGRHEALRTVFRWDDDGPVQVVLDRWHLPLPLVDLSSVPAADRDDELHRLLDDESRRPFDLSRDLMVRTTLYRLAADEHVLLLLTHHIASDGWSVGVFCRDLGELYRARRAGEPAQLPELTLHYRDFAVWQRGRLQGERLANGLAYWRAKLAGAPTILLLPTDRPRPGQLTFDGGSHRIALPREITERVHRLCRERQVTPYMLLLAVFGTLLYRLTGQDDILISSPFANRSRTEYDQLVGFFANTLVLRVRLAANPPFTELLAQVRETIVEALDHQEVPFERVVEAVRPQRDPALNPLAQVNFRVRVDPPTKPELDGASTSRVPVDAGFAAFDLALDLDVLDEGITGELLYNTNLFEQGSIERIASDFDGLLGQLLHDPDTRLLALELPSERQLGTNGHRPGGATIRRFRETSSSQR